MEQADNRAFLWDGDSFFEYRKEVGFPAKLFVHKHGGLKKKREMISGGYTRAPLVGILQADLDPVDSILRQAETVSVRRQQEEIAGSSCHVIEAVTDHGQYTVWIDPGHGYNIAQAEVHKTEGDLAWGKRIGQAGATHFRSTTFALKNVRFGNIRGVWVPLDADYETTIDHGGYVSVARTQHRCKHFGLEPDLDAMAAFVPDIPNGTQTVVLENLDTTFE